MPYSVPRRRGNSIRLAALGSSDSEAAVREESVAPLRMLNSLPTNVIIHSPSPSASPKKQQREKVSSQSSLLSKGLSPSHSAFGLPTPPHSHSTDAGEPRQSATPENISPRITRNSPHLKMTPRSIKRSNDSPGTQQSSASKRRAVQGGTPRSIHPTFQSAHKSPSKSRVSPVKSLASDLLRRNLLSKRGDEDDEDDDEAYTRDRIILLPTKRTRDLSKSRLLENADTTTFDSSLPETSRRVLFENELRMQQQREKEQQAIKQLEMQLADDYTDLMHIPDHIQSPLKLSSVGLQQEDSIKAHKQYASSPSARLSTPPVPAASPSKPGALFNSPPRPSSPAASMSTPLDTLLSPSQSRHRLESNQQPMESTPFRLGKKKVGGRRSTPHPGAEGKIRASLAALDSPRRAQRVIKDDEEIALERAMSPSPSKLRNSISREVTMELDTTYLTSIRPPERELSTILAIEQDNQEEGASDEVDDLSHFTVEASRVRMNLAPEKLGEHREEQVEREVLPTTARVVARPDESEEILADDFVYETVLADESEPLQEPSRRRRDSIASSRDSSPILMDMQYNPEGDMNLDWEEVQRKKQEMEDEENTQRYLMSRSYNSIQAKEAEHGAAEENDEEREQILDEGSLEGEEGPSMHDDDVQEEGENFHDEDEDERAALERDSHSQREATVENDSMEDSEEDEEVLEEEMTLTEESDDESMQDEETAERSEDDEGLPIEVDVKELEVEQGLDIVAEDSDSDAESSVVDDHAELSDEEDSSEGGPAEEEESEEEAGVASEKHTPAVEVALHTSQSNVTERPGNASTLRKLDNTVMDSTFNNSLWRSFTERTRLLTARPGAVEVSSMNRENAARATAILTLFHKYVQYGVLDVEIDDEDIEASMHHHTLAQEASALRQLLSRKGGLSEADKTLDEVLAEKQAEVQGTEAESRLQVPLTPALTTMTVASPKTPLLPGAFPRSSAKSRTGDNNLYLSPEKIADKSFRFCQPSEVNLGIFSKQNWQALESVVKSEISASARALLGTSRMKQEEALLQAALGLDQAELAEAFLHAYKAPSSCQVQLKEWSEGKVQSKVASLVRRYLISLQEKHPNLGIDADALADATLSRVNLTSAKEKQVDESGVAETSLRLPFKMVTESTPAASSAKHAATQNTSLVSPSLDRVDRSSGFNIYPQLPKPLAPFNAQWKCSKGDKASSDVSSKDKSIEKSGDTSSGLTGLASRSLDFVYASMGWKKAPVVEAKEKPAEVVEKPKDVAPARTASLLPRPTSSNLADYSSVSYNRSRSQISYGIGSSRLIRSGVSSSVDPTALALLSPHTHQLAKAKVQQFKDSRKEKNWRSPRHDRLGDASNSSISRLRWR